MSRSVGRTALLVFLVVGAASAAVAPAAGAADAAGTPEFTDSVVTATQGETAEVTVSFANASTDAARVAVGSPEVNFEVVATLADADGDGTATLRVDLSEAGNGDPASYLSTADGAALSNASETVSPENTPLDPASYDLTLGPADGPHDVGTLSVQDDGDDESQGEGDGPGDDRATADNGTVLVYEGERLAVAAAPNRTVTGETRLDPGTELDVMLQSTSASSPFLRTDSVTVTESGTFTATFDMSDVSPGVTFDVFVRRDEETLEEADGAVVECEADCVNGSGAAVPADEVAVESVVDVARGRVAEIPVGFGDADAVTLAVGSADVGYRVTATVRDADGDGRATVLFYTNRTNGTAPLFRAAGPDEVVAQGDARLGDVLDPAPYDLALHAGTGADGSPDDVGTLQVVEAPSDWSANRTSDTPTPADTVMPPDDRPNASGDLLGDRAAGASAIALGGLLAVVSVGVFFGVFRT